MTTTPLLVLAAGMGSRYGGLKQIDAIGPDGETIIDYSVYDAMRAGFDELVFVIRHDIEDAFREAVGRRFEQRIAVRYVFQELAPPRTKPWGTGHAILMAADVIAAPFGVINADDFYGADSFRLLGEHLRAGDASAALVGFELRNTLSEFGSVARGVCQVTDGCLDSVREVLGIERQAVGASHPLRGDEIVSMNMWGFDPTMFERLREQWREFLDTRSADGRAELYIPEVVNTAVQRQQLRVRVLPTRSTWFGVTYREDRPRVAAGIRELIRSRAYPDVLWTRP